MLNLKNLTNPKSNKNMIPNQTPTKTTTLSDVKGILTCACILAAFIFFITISEDKSKLTPIQSNINVQAQSEKALTPEQEINKLKLELDIKQKQAELSKIDPKAPALK